MKSTLVFAIALAIALSASGQTIQSLINAAPNNSTVLVAPGTYTGIGNRDLTLNGKALTIKANGGPVVVDCQGQGRGFIFLPGDSAATRIVGFEIVNGFASGSSPLGKAGAGVYIDGASPTFKRCTIRSCDLSTTFPIGFGSGIYLRNSQAQFIRCCIFDNDAGPVGVGGGVYALHSNAFFRSCFVTENTGAGAAGVEIDGSSPAFGMRNCTIAGNFGIGVGASISPQALGHLYMCIVWGNTSGDIVTADGMPQNHFTVTYTDVGPTWTFGGTGNISADPLFVNPALANYDIVRLSPCVDAGDPSYVLLPNERDHHGTWRKLFAAVDMGADEYGAIIAINPQ